MAAKKQNPKPQSQQEPKQTQEKDDEEEEPLQALRLKAIAEQKYTSGNLTSALNYAKRAHNLRPNLTGVSEMLTAYNILNTDRQAPVDNYYRILQVERFSHINSIKRQYKKLALILHPDKNPFAASEEAFKLVGEAFRVLSDKVRRKEYDMKIMISMQAEAAVGMGEEEEGGKGVETFWTACSTCRLLHKFERKYLGHNLVCPSCKKSFKAVEVSENGKEGEEDEEDDVVVGRMGGGARVRGRRGGKFVDSGKGLLKRKRKVDSVGEAPERSERKKVKMLGGNEGKSEGLRSKEAEKGNNEGAGGDSESSDMIERARLRDGRKVIVGEEVVGRKRMKRVNVGEEEMMTLAEMQTIAKQKMSEVKGKEMDKEEGKAKVKVKAKVTVKEKEEGKEAESRKEKEKEKEEASVKENEKVREDGGEKDKEKEEESVKEKEKGQEDERDKEKEKEIEEGETEEEMAMVKMNEKRDRLVVLENEHLRVVERRASETSNINKEKEMEEVREKEIEKEQEEDRDAVKEKDKESEPEERVNDKEREKELEEGREKEKESRPEEKESNKGKEMAVVKEREKRERRKTWKFESFWVAERRGKKEKEKEKEMEEERETSMVKVKEKRSRRNTSKIESLKVMKRKEEIEKEKEGEEEMEKETKTSMVKVKEKRDRPKTPKNESLEIGKNRALRSENMEIEKHKGWNQSSLEIVAVEDSDFYDFDKDRVGRNLKKGQVWALYDDNDGMPRHYALIDKVVSVNPFEARLNLLEFQSNGDEALISWEKLGFRISCGRFKVSTSFVVKSLKIFSHIADCERAARELYRIYPKKGSVWAIYNENSSDAEERNMTFENKSCYDIVVFLTSYSEIHGLSMAYLEKVDGFRTVFQRREIGAHAIRWLEKEDYRMFSHQIPARKLSGEEVTGLSKDCWELDPASIPPEMLAIGWDRENLPVQQLIEM